MSSNIGEQRTGPRYMVRVSVRADCDDKRSGGPAVVQGETDISGPQGAVVHLERLPDVRSRVHLIAPDAEGRTLETVAEVLRLERNPVQPLAALHLLGETDEWRGLVWEPAGIREREADEDYSEYEH